MDGFEHLATEIFWVSGYWVRTGFKVELTRDEKIKIGKHSSPRLEVDLLAWSTANNELLVLECKSYFASGEVHAAHFLPEAKYAHRYKLFHGPVLRATVLERPRLQCLARGLCSPDAQIRLGLVHGHVTRHNTARLQPILELNDWLLHGPHWARRHLAELAAGSYDNSKPRWWPSCCCGRTLMTVRRCQRFSGRPGQRSSPVRQLALC